MPVLWRNPSENIDSSLTARKLLFNVILLHLSEESRDILKNQGVNKLINEVMNKYQRPLFDYLSFWKYLDLYFLEIVISSKFDGQLNLPIIRNEILKLFINENTNLMHLLIPQYFDYQLHLIPGAEYCLSRLDSLHCHADLDQSILEGFARICKLIKKLSLVNVNYCTNNSGIIKLIEEQKKLNDVSFDDDGVEHGSFYWGFKLEDMELFLKSWEGKNPLLLEMSFCVVRDEDKFEDLLKYFMEKGMIEYYSIGGGRINENFEWI
ncbi:unnamed protein product [Rhizophagus irregularis]|nr:unnamed protein product [Rhizophagus irregularis]